MRYRVLGSGKDPGEIVTLFFIFFSGQGRLAHSPTTGFKPTHGRVIPGASRFRRDRVRQAILAATRDMGADARDQSGLTAVAQETAD